MAIGDPYVSLGDFKSYLEIYDNADDVRLSNSLQAASSAVDDVCRRQFNNSSVASTKEYSINWRSRTAIVGDFHTLTDFSVEVGSKESGYGTSWVLDTDYFVGPLNTERSEISEQVYWRVEVLGAQRFPYAYGSGYNLKVTARWGWPSVPERIQEATKILASRLFRRRDSPEGVIGGFGGEAIRVGYKMDPDVAMMIKPFRKHVKGVFF